MKHLKKFNEMNVEITGEGGIHCDNPKCDYNDENVPTSDYPKWINKSCPKCGENLLTQDDYDDFMKIKNAVDAINQIPKEQMDELSKKLNLSDNEIIDAYNKLKELGFRQEEPGTSKFSYQSPKYRKD